MPNSPEELFTVVSWNILLDKTRTKAGLVVPQIERIPSHAQTLMDLEVPLDVVAIQEAQNIKTGHNGELLAELVGCKPGYWFEHNQLKRKHEYIGMFGQRVDSAEELDVTDNKKAVITRLGDIAVATVHLRNQRRGIERAQQITTLLNYLDESEKAVITGDFNAIPQEHARRLLRKQGFKSVFKIMGIPRPATFPTAQYRDIMWGHKQQRIFKKPMVSIDDIYVRGVGVQNTGAFIGDSDHVGLWAQINP